jgi:hypothetical protein
MRSLTKAFLLGLALAVVFAPGQARAEGYVTPWVGTDLASETDNGRSVFGVTGGYMAAGLFGFEADFGYSPNFLGSSTEFGTNNAITLMGNFILGLPIGGTHGAGVRPFISGGLGLMRTHLAGGTVVNTSRSINEPGYDVGIGMMGFFNDHIGLRGDVRYMHMGQPSQGSGFDLEHGIFSYWRLAGGVTFR